MRSTELAAVRSAAFVLGAMPDHLGQFRVAQWYWWKRRPDHQVVRQRMADGTRLALDLGDRTQALAYLTRRYSEELVKQLIGLLPPGGLLFDVGANAGLITFQVAHRRPDVRIVAFEPNPGAVVAWRGNHALNHSADARLEVSAVTDRCGVVHLDAPSSDLGAGLLSDDGRGVEVPGLALDRYCRDNGIERIDVMKVDVEGSEPEVLRGAQELMRTGRVGALIVEFNDGHFERRGLTRGSVVSWLADHGMFPRGSVDAEDVAFAPAA